MNEIFKRLEILKSAIDIEENDTISVQVLRLKELNIDNVVLNILKKVKNREFEDALVLATEYLNKYNNLVVYEDPKVKALKLKLKILEKELNTLSKERNKFLAKINKFNAMYLKYVGNIVNEIVKLKGKFAQQEFDRRNIDKNEFKEIKREFKNFYYEPISEAKKVLFKLSKEDEKRLKSLYRKTCFLIHPDVVSKEFKEEASKIFNDLNEAYINKDLKRVEKLLKDLESGVIFVSGFEKIDSIEVLEERFKTLKEKIKVLKEEIEEIKRSETFQIIEDTKDLDSYFENLKEELVNSKKELENDFTI
ncbi:MAG TPA: hypothetical protein ENK66_03900 [Arcobacter sp.]|nr:hypothetical protein [Arcobacter sp.]